jgi:hypothetical protein
MQHVVSEIEKYEIDATYNFTHSMSLTTPDRAGQNYFGELQYDTNTILRIVQG